MTATGAAVALSAYPSEAIRMAVEFERAVRATPEGSWLAPVLAERLDALRAGEPVDGFLWVGPSDEAVGLALTGPPSEAGITVQPYLADGYRTAATLTSFVRAIEPHQPVRVIYEPVVGVSDADLGDRLGHLGFRRIVRVDMGFEDGTSIPDVPDDGALPSRPLTASDAPALAKLMARSYADNLDDRTLFQRWRDPEEDALHAVDEMLGEGLGVWRHDASFGVPVADGLASATLVHDFHGPLISEVMTDPAWRRRGLARRLLLRSVAAVRTAGLGAPRLVVTLENRRAHALYRSLGFTERPDAKGAAWIRPPPPVGPIGSV
jgi:ribosomal protein S18 acetylase RimI-like enzyme